MANFGGVELGVGGSGIFELTTEADDEEFQYTFSDGADAIVPPRGRYIVVRSCPGATFTETHARAHEAANVALDVYHAYGGKPLLVEHRESPYVVGWVSPNGYTLRIVGRAITTSRITVTGEATYDTGAPIQPAPPPLKKWHESSRYYRVSESSTDLFDSFRNLYLALESLLSSVIPRAETEGESRWLKRALGEVSSHTDLAPFMPLSSDSPSDAIYQELYVTLRTAIFHAKSGRQVWVPQDWGSRAQIIEARVRYAHMFRTLASAYLNIPYPGSFLYRPFIEDLLEESLSHHVVFVSNDSTAPNDFSTGEPEAAPVKGDILILPTQDAEDMAAEWRRGRTGVLPGSSVHDALGQVQRFGTLREGDLAVLDGLRAPLVVDGASEVQVVILIEGRNYDAPRQDFGS